MQQPTSINAAIEENRLVFAYGQSIDTSALRILTAATQSGRGTVFYAFKTNHEARHAYNMEVAVGELRAGLAVGDAPLHSAPEYDIYSNSTIFCSTGKLRNILLEQIRIGRLGMIGWVMIRSWEEYDANAYVVANLVRKYCPDTPITLLGYSEWSYLPYNDSTVVPIPLPQVKIEYLRKAAAYPLLETVKEKTLFYGPESSLGTLRGKVERLSDLNVVPDAYNVVDTLKSNSGKPISKHLADLRADSIVSGVVYRLATKEEFDTLRARNPIKVDNSLQEAIVHLKRAGIEPLSMLGTNHPSEEVKRIEATLKGTNLDGLDLDKIVSLRLGIAPGIFYVSWTGMGKAGERNRYIPGLISSLIKRSPSALAPIENYKKFVGRNDIETLCNVWSSVLLTHSGAFWGWKTNKYVSAWCTSNGFNLEAVNELIGDMKRVCLGMKGGHRLFDNITTDELNTATNIFKSTEDQRGNTQVPKNRRGVLPQLASIRTEDILPVLSHGSNLEIYVDRNHPLVKTPIRAEPVNLFFGM